MAASIDRSVDWVSRYQAVQRLAYAKDGCVVTRSPVDNYWKNQLVGEIARESSTPKKLRMYVCIDMPNGIYNACVDVC